ncbi:MAG: hypothetical protein JW981_08720, partial [Anaerolineae bacterium]|nr:hypothetical protein [Anaerolineae bacterium]
MVDTWQTIAKKFLPDLESLGEPRRVSKTADVIGVLYGIPFTLLALAWLIRVTQLRPLLTAWPVLLLSFILLVLLRRLEFFVMVELTPGRFADFSGSLDGIIAWAAVLIFGPAALWLHIICNCLNLVIEWQQDLSGERRYALMRNFLFTLSGTVLSTLVILTLYRQWGGSIPLPGLEWHVVRLGLYVTLVRFCLSLLVWLPYFAYLGRSKTVTATKSSRQTFIKFVGLSMSWPLLSDPFAIFAAGLYTQIGIEGYLFFAVAVLLSSLLARQLSRVGVRSQSRSREMANLEQLGRAIISAPPDIFSLQQVLQTHIPTMFMGSTIEIRLFPDQTLLHYPKDYAPASPALWEWLAGINDVEVFLPEDVLPWDMDAPFNGATLIVSPILDAETGATIGGICLTSYAQHRNPDLIKDSVPSVKSLAAQITSALYSARVHEQILEHQRVSQELSMAGRIQFSFLPHNISDISGWQLAAKLYPAY